MPPSEFLKQLPPGIAFLYFALCLFTIGFGFMAVFAKNLLWRITVYTNKLQGKEASPRTRLWDIGSTVSGVIAILGGTVFLSFLIAV